MKLDVGFLFSRRTVVRLAISDLRMVGDAGIARAPKIHIFH